MTGPEHYREAERLLELALNHQANGLVPRSVDICNAQAAVHAMLALAAATAMTAAGVQADGRTGEEWRNTIVRPRITNGQVADR